MEMQTSLFKSGIIVTSNFDFSDPSIDIGEAYSSEPQLDKSILWNGSASNLGREVANELNDQSFWEVRGGALMLSRMVNKGTVEYPNWQRVSYAFHINDSEDLTVLKTEGDSNTLGTSMVLKNMQFMSYND